MINWSEKWSDFFVFIGFGCAATLDKGVEEQKVKAQPPVKSLKAPPSFKGIEHKIPLAKTLGKVSKSSISATAFSVADLQEATNSFSQDNLIGEGILGRVYRADFPNGQVLAVKKLDSSASVVHNEDDFLAAVDSLARLKQSNTVELVGYCVEHDQRLLVYEYISRGTLNELLHSSLDNTKGLSWNVRVKIALGSARALEYAFFFFRFPLTLYLLRIFVAKVCWLHGPCSCASCRVNRRIS